MVTCKLTSGFFYLDLGLAKKVLFVHLRKHYDVQYEHALKIIDRIHTKKEKDFKCHRHASIAEHAVLGLVNILYRL